MDKTWINLLKSYSDKKIDFLLDLVPVWKTTSKIRNRINSIVWGINYPNKISKYYLQRFLISNTVNNIIKRKDQEIVKNKLNWERHFKNITKNPWQIFEYFLVDYLERTKNDFKEYKKYNFKFNHTKATPEQDQEKIDFLSTLFTEDENLEKNKITFWVQLTTEKSKAMFKKDSKNMWISKKESSVKKISKKIEKNRFKNYSKIYIPDLMVLLVVNSHINRLLNIENNNIFKDAFNQWKAENFSSSWPNKFLNKSVQDDFKLISTWYHYWLKNFYRFLKNICKPWIQDFKVMSDKYEDFYIVSSYNKQKEDIN